MPGQACFARRKPGGAGEHKSSTQSSQKMLDALSSFSPGFLRPINISPCMNKLIALIALALCSLVVARAEIITGQLTGQITSIIFHGMVFETGFLNGDTFHGQCYYDTATVTQSVADKLEGLRISLDRNVRGFEDGISASPFTGFTQLSGSGLPRAGVFSGEPDIIFEDGLLGLNFGNWSLVGTIQFSLAAVPAVPDTTDGGHAEWLIVLAVLLVLSYLLTLVPQQYPGSSCASPTINVTLQHGSQFMFHLHKVLKFLARQHLAQAPRLWRGWFCLPPRRP